MKKLFGLLAVLGLGAVCLAGCQSTPESDTVTVTDMEGKISPCFLFCINAI